MHVRDRAGQSGQPGRSGSCCAHTGSLRRAHFVAILPRRWSGPRRHAVPSLRKARSTGSSPFMRRDPRCRVRRHRRRSSGCCLRRFGSRVDYYAEYVDVARFADPSYVVALRDFLGHKYAKIDVDVVIATSASTFELARDSRACISQRRHRRYLQSKRNKGRQSTGVTLDINMHGSLDLALALQPDVTQVFVVSGGSDFDRFYEDAASSGVQPYESPDIHLSLGLAMDDLEQQIAHLPEGGIV